MLRLQVQGSQEARREKICTGVHDEGLTQVFTPQFSSTISGFTHYDSCESALKSENDCVTVFFYTIPKA